LEHSATTSSSIHKKLYLALRDLNVKGQIVRAGTKIWDVSPWHPVALQSCINIGWMKEIPYEEKPNDGPKPLKPGPFSCCGKKFGSKRALSVHKRRSHE